MKKLIVVLVCAVCVLALASTAVPAAEQGGRIGFGAAFIPDYEGSDDMQGWPTVFGRYTWENGIFVDLGSSSDGRAARAKGNVIQERWVDILKAGPVLQYRFERDDVDDDRVDNMKSVDSAIEVGGFVGLVI